MAGHMQPDGWSPENRELSVVDRRKKGAGAVMAAAVAAAAAAAAVQTEGVPRRTLCD